MYRTDGHASASVALNLSVSPGVKSSTSFAVHLIPSVRSFNSGIPISSIDLTRDAQLDLGLKAFNIETGAFLDLDASATLELDLNGDADADLLGADANSTNLSSEVDGCVDLKGGLAVNVGLDGDSVLFDFLGDSTTINLAGKEFDFWKVGPSIYLC